MTLVNEHLVICSCFLKFAANSRICAPGPLCFTSTRYHTLELEMGLLQSMWLYDVLKFNQKDDSKLTMLPWLFIEDTDWSGLVWTTNKTYGALKKFIFRFDYTITDYSNKSFAQQMTQFHWCRIILRHRFSLSILWDKEDSKAKKWQTQPD